LLINLALQKTDLTRFFITEPRHPGHLKRQIWVKKRSGNPGHQWRFYNEKTGGATVGPRKKVGGKT